MAKIDPSDLTVDDLKNEIVDIQSTSELEEILDAEKEGKNRKTALDAINKRLEVVREEGDGGVEERLEEEIESAREQIKDRIEEGRDTVNEGIVDILSTFLQTPARTEVYVSLRRQENADVDDIAEDTGIYPKKIEKILGDMVEDGVVSRSNGVYTAVRPTDAVRTWRDRLDNLIETQDGQGLGGRKEFSLPFIQYRVVFEEKEEEKEA